MTQEMKEKNLFWLDNPWGYDPEFLKKPKKRGCRKNSQDSSGRARKPKCR